MSRVSAKIYKIFLKNDIILPVEELNPLIKGDLIKLMDRKI